MNNEHTSIAVLGGGSWATALVKILLDNSLSKTVHWWIRNEQKANYLHSHKHNRDYLSSITFDLEHLNVTSRIETCIESADIVILAIPSAFVHASLSSLDAALFKDKIIVSAVKGLIPETSEILGDYFKNLLNVESSCIGVITGPCHAEEVALEKLSYLTIASEDSHTANKVSSLLKGEFIKTSTTDDIYGTEYSAVLKNVYAIAAGICHGLRFGDNFQAVLVSNAIREIKRFIAAVHPIERDIDDSAYLGDLVVTTYSQFSRNRTFGNMLGKGYSVKSAQLEMNMVAEGYYAVKTVHDMNQSLQVDMPLADFVYEVVYNGKRAKSVIENLLNALN
ncbi:MAG: NAD(P)H-dependent glycerol-3-phosphate dehydrogenase [Bacteroidetes bacterium]|nr:NAD(P)H-dependent glycerol-3-phosphate dehydrogenase [Bacteroidota bacterium]